MSISKTGIEGLDDILAGGFPSGQLYLIEGFPGSGKTTLAMQFLLDGIRNDESCLYITLSESKSELYKTAESHGWKLDKINIFELPLTERLGTSDQTTFFYASETELGETNDIILKEIERVNPSRVVFDSLSELKLLAHDSIRFRKQILALKNYFEKQGATVLLLDDKTAAIGSAQELQSIAHGVLQLEQIALDYGVERRRLKISKLRALAYRGGFHDFTIRKGGMVVFPRLIANEHGIRQKRENVLSGVKQLDEVIGGGIKRGSSTLIMGPAGSGKSTITLQYASHMASKNEKIAIFAFDEGRESAMERADGLGLKFEDHLTDGTISFTKVDPAEFSPGEFMYLVKDKVEKFGASTVIIDSINGYLQSMPDERFLIIQMHELLTYLNQMGALTFVVAVQHGILGTTNETSSIDMSYLADNVILLRYFEVRGSVKRAISVVKKRSGHHELSIREISFSHEGITIGEPLRNFQGVLTGVPHMLEDGEVRK